MENNLIGCLIITHNPPLEILNETINKLLEYKNIINIFIIDNSDKTFQLYPCRHREKWSYPFITVFQRYQWNIIQGFCELQDRSEF